MATTRGRRSSRGCPWSRCKRTRSLGRSDEEDYLKGRPFCMSKRAKPTGRGRGFQTRRREFDSLRPCAIQLHRDRTSWAPDPRPGREADERRGTGLTVTRPWRSPSNPDPSGSGGELNSEQHQAGAGPMRSGDLSAAVTQSETSGTPAPRHMCRLGNRLARLVVTQVPSGRAGSSPARRTSPRKHCGDAPDSYSGEQGSIPWRGTGR